MTYQNKTTRIRALLHFENAVYRVLHERSNINRKIHRETYKETPTQVHPCQYLIRTTILKNICEQLLLLVETAN